MSRFSKDFLSVSGCVCECRVTPLILIIPPAFNDVAEHDVKWGEYEIPFLDNEYPPGDDYQEYYISLGLDFLRKLINATTYDHRYQLLSSNWETEEYSMYQAMKVADTNLQNTRMSSLTEEQKMDRFKLHNIQDVDKGPAEAWFWAYQHDWVSPGYFSRSQRDLRQSGYVMFDYERLVQWGLFDQPFPALRPNPLEENERHSAIQRSMRDSWTKRSRVWQRGGQGWWSEGDESRITWGFTDQW